MDLNEDMRENGIGESEGKKPAASLTGDFVKRRRALATERMEEQTDKDVEDQKKGEREALKINSDEAPPEFVKKMKTAETSKKAKPEKTKSEKAPHKRTAENLTTTDAVTVKRKKYAQMGGIFVAVYVVCMVVLLAAFGIL